MIYVNFEGPDASGKSTVLKHIEERFNQALAGDSLRKFISTREPKGIFRDIILDPSNSYNLTEIARFFLYQADRSIHLKEVIVPNMYTNNIVVSDRGPLSTLVYQSLTTGLSYSSLIEVTKIANENIWPDLFIVFTCDYETAKKRMEGRELDYFDKKGKDFYDNLTKLYITTGRDLITSYGHNVYFIDAKKDLNSVIEEVWDILVSYIN